MDYKEISTKKGKRLVFCNIEELLKELLGCRTTEELEQHAKGDEYIVHCPFCKEEGHTKHKLYIRKDMTVGHCFVCCREYINVTDEVDVRYTVPEYSNYWNEEDSALEVVELSDPEWTLDKFIYEFDDEDEVGEAYLDTRHALMREEAKALDFKYMDGNVVMPFKYHGKVFYYQIRFSGNSKIRYFFPPISAKPPYIIEHGENKKFILCEGVYDAAALLIQAPEYTPFACMGSSISDYQIKFLKEYGPEEILIYMDETSISKKIGDRLKRYFNCPISIIKSNGEDPEEHMKYLLKKGKDPRWIESKNFFKDIDSGGIKFKYNFSKEW